MMQVFEFEFARVRDMRTPVGAFHYNGHTTHAWTGGPAGGWPSKQRSWGGDAVQPCCPCIPIRGASTARRARIHASRIAATGYRDRAPSSWSWSWPLARAPWTSRPRARQSRKHVARERGRCACWMHLAGRGEPETVLWRGVSCRVVLAELS